MTTPDRRNPYVTLGVPFGASRDETSAAFARRARGLRRAPGGAEILKELTWALNQIDEVLKDPHLALEIYRVPADAGAFDPVGDGVLRPGPERLARQSGDSTEALARLVEAAGHEAVAAARAEVVAAATLPDR